LGYVQLNTHKIAGHSTEIPVVCRKLPLSFRGWFQNCLFNRHLNSEKVPAGTVLWRSDCTQEFTGEKKPAQNTPWLWFYWCE